MSIRVMAGGVVAAGLLMAACGGDDDGGGGQLGTGDDYSVMGALAELPASLEFDEGQIFTGDLSAATDAAGLERPADVEDTEAFTEWFNPLTGGPVDDESERVAFVPMAGQAFAVGRGPSELGGFEDELGWSVLDADSFVEYNVPPANFSVISGSFDDETLSDDLIELDDGIVTNSENEDGEQDLTDRSAVDELGRPVRLAHDDGRIASSLQTAPTQEWVQGADETLADHEDLAAVASALDDADVFSATLSQGSPGFDASAVIEEMAGGETDADALRELMEQEAGALPPSPFSTVGIGWAADDDGAAITIAYQHASEDDASANAEALEELFADGSSLNTNQPLSEFYDVEEIETDGTVAVVTLRPGPEGLPNTAWDALIQRDSPFVHA